MTPKQIAVSALGDLCAGTADVFDQVACVGVVDFLDAKCWWRYEKTRITCCRLKALREILLNPGLESQSRAGFAHGMNNGTHGFLNAIDRRADHSVKLSLVLFFCEKIVIYIDSALPCRLLLFHDRDISWLLWLACSAVTSLTSSRRAK